MRQKPSRFLLLALPAIIVAAIYVSIRFQNPTNSQAVILDTPTPDVQATQSYRETVTFERTAIAVFTQNPTLALSSTPFYVEIIYNEVVRNLTEIPFPIRGSYLGSVTATHMAMLLTTTPTPISDISTITTPTQICTTTISTHVLSDLSREIIQLLERDGIEARVSVTSLGVEGIDSACMTPFQAVRSRFEVYINVASINDTARFVEMIAGVLDVLLGNWNHMEYVSNNAYISIFFDGEDGDKFVVTTYQAVVEAYETGLQGDALLEALGGFGAGSES